MAVIDPSHSPQWAHSFAAAQQRFVADLEAAGFCSTDEANVWEGELEVASLSGGTENTTLLIEIGDAFPFAPPKVTDISMASTRTWHHNPDWSLCLYTTHNVYDRPWQTVASLLARICEWFESAAGEWSDDPPDLDLERYFEQARTFVTYDTIDALVGKPVGASHRPNSLHIDRAGHVPRKRRSKRKGARLWGWAGDLGQLDQPVYDWTTVHERLGQDANDVEAKIQQGEYQFLALRYRRDAQQGVIVLIPRYENGRIQLEAAISAADDEGTRKLRAGNPRAVKRLQRTTVAIVGVGAIGSFLADMLARAGVAKLVLVDPDIVRPGNCIRHLASYDQVGEFKTRAVRSEIAERGLLPVDAIDTIERQLTPEVAVDLLSAADLVIDATANDNVRGMLAALHDSATTNGLETTLVSIAIHRSGGIVRSDRWPRVDSLAPAPIPPHPEGETELYESGCGDPVSTTPAGVVLEAAGLATRHSIDLLTGANQLPSSIINVLIPQPDAPYQALGAVST